MDLSAMDLSAAGLRAQRTRMTLIASNLANVDATSAMQETVLGAGGQTYVRHVPYRRQVAVLVQGADGAPSVRVTEDASEPRAERRPEHPHAVPASSGEPDAGTVYFPNVNPMVETVDLIAATPAYEANVTAMEVTKSMHQVALRILG
jgi:flagellar basal-body rod protein FlgC